MTTTVVITSGKGGVGKTNISVNAAIELARQDHRVCLLDADLGLANVAILLGLYPDKTLDDVIANDVSLGEIIVQTDHGVDVIPGSSGVEEMANLDGEQLSRLVDGFTDLEGYDYLLIDTSSGISRGVISFCLAASETLLVLTGEATSLTDAYGLLKVLSLNNYQGTVKILVNKCTSVPQAKKTFGHFKSVVDRRLDIKIVPGGVILKDATVEEAVSKQQPAQVLFPQNTFSLCIKALISNLTKKVSGRKDSGTCTDFWSRYVDYLQADLHLPGARKQDISLEQQKTRGPETTKGDNGQVEADAVLEKMDPSSVQSVEPDVVKRDELGTAYCKTPPALLALILELQSAGQLTPEKMRELIACDPGLTMRVLHMSHVSGSAEAKGVVSIQDVLGRIDEQMLFRLLISTATKVLLNPEMPAASAARSRWWCHSLRCAMVAKALAKLAGEPLSEAAYLAGLLHDIGGLGEKGDEAERGGEMSPLAEEKLDPKSVTAREKGGSHSECAASIMAELNICSLVVDAVRYHQETKRRIATAFAMTKLVHMAHLLSTPREKELSRAIEVAKEHFQLSASQVLTCLQAVNREFSLVTAECGISCRGDIELNEIGCHLQSYRNQAVEYITMQGVLQLPARPEISDMVCAIHQGLSQLFAINRIVCLFPGKDRLFLHAEGYPGCYCQDNIKNIQFSLNSERSLVVAGYHSKTSTILSSASLQSLADRAVMDILVSEVLLCLPLYHPTAGEKQGIILCGLARSQRAIYSALQDKMEKFAMQVAIKMNTCL